MMGEHLRGIAGFPLAVLQCLAARGLRLSQAFRCSLDHRSLSLNRLHHTGRWT